MDESTHVALRDVIPDDLPVFFEHQLEPEANEMAAFPPRERDAFMAHWHKILPDVTAGSTPNPNPRPSTTTTYTKITKTVLADGRVAGNILSWEEHGRREVGYWMGKEFWGRGVATTALRLLLDLVTTRPLYAHVAKHNVASIRVLEKCGFTPAPIDDADDGEVLLKLDA